MLGASHVSNGEIAPTALVQQQTLNQLQIAGPGVVSARTWLAVALHDNLSNLNLKSKYTF